MKILFKDKSGEQGSVMIVALVILVLLTIIGISATSTTNIETQIAGNEKFQKIAFYTADSGVPTSAKLISTIMDSQSQPALTAVTYAEVEDVTEPLLGQIMGYEPYDNGSRDVTFTFSSNTTASADIERTGTEVLAGGGVEFGSGAEGVGGGTAGGGVAIFYDIDSEGNGPSNSKSGIIADYRKIIGVAGGL